jgi:hypothetical protein
MNDKPESDEPIPLIDLMSTPPDSGEPPNRVMTDDDDYPEKPKRKPKPNADVPGWFIVGALLLIVLVSIVITLQPRLVSQPSANDMRLTANAAQAQLAPVEGIVTVMPPPTFTPTAFLVTSGFGAELGAPGPVPSHTGAVPITTADSLDEKGCAGKATTTFTSSTTLYVVIESELKMGQTLDVRLYADDRITEILHTPSLVVDQDYAHVCASFKFEPRPSAALDNGTYIADVSMGGFFLGNTAFTIE